MVAELQFDRAVTWTGQIRAGPKRRRASFLRLADVLDRGWRQSLFHPYEPDLIRQGLETESVDMTRQG